MNIKLVKMNENEKLRLIPKESCGPSWEGPTSGLP